MSRDGNELILIGVFIATIGFYIGINIDDEVIFKIPCMIMGWAGVFQTAFGVYINTHREKFY